MSKLTKAAVAAIFLTGVQALAAAGLADTAAVLEEECHKQLNLGASGCECIAGHAEPTRRLCRHCPHNLQDSCLTEEPILPVFGEGIQYGAPLEIERAALKSEMVTAAGCVPVPCPVRGQRPVLFVAGGFAATATHLHVHPDSGLIHAIGPIDPILCGVGFMLGWGLTHRDQRSLLWRSLKTLLFLAIIMVLMDDGTRPGLANETFVRTAFVALLITMHLNF